jgi:hypothetical protein
MADYVEEGNSESRSDFLQDLLIGHQLGILRVANGTTRSVIERMNVLEDAFIASIILELQRLEAVNAANYVAQQPKIERVVKKLSQQRMSSWEESKSLINKEMVALALWEATWQADSLKKVLNNSPQSLGRIRFQELSFPQSAAETLVRRTPIRGKTLGDWTTLLAENDVQQVAQEIRLGMRDGLSPLEIGESIRGTQASDFSDGISARLRDKVDGVVKTAAVEVTQSVREKVWVKNKKRISGLVWSAVLDSRTSEICRGLDGRVAPLFGMEDTLDPELPRLEPPTLRPPAHFRCRSMMSAVVDGILPRQTSYEQWLTKQPADVQKDILGPRRFRLLETGTLDFSKLFDGPTGRPLTLAELQVREGFE